MSLLDSALDFSKKAQMAMSGIIDIVDQFNYPQDSPRGSLPEYIAPTQDLVGGEVDVVTPPKFRSGVPGPHNICTLNPINGGTIITAEYSKLNFPNFPDEISDSENAHYDPVTPMFRKGPILGYSGSSARQIGFTLTFYASIDVTDDFSDIQFSLISGSSSALSELTRQDSLNNVKKKVDFLKASQYPNYKDWMPPPRWRLSLGSLMTLTGIISRCNVTWKGPFTHKDALPLVAEVQINFDEAERTPKSFTDMASGRTGPAAQYGGPSQGLSIYEGSDALSATGFPSSTARLTDAQKEAIERGELGTVAAIGESGGAGPGTISTGKGDAGGMSYGTFQMSSNTNTVADYVAQSEYSKEFEGLTPGTPEFNAKWKEIANADPQGFNASQTAYIAATHYAPVINGSTYNNLGLSKFNDSIAIQEAIFSTGVQFGGPKTNQVLTNAFSGKDVGSMTETQILEALYAEKGKTSDGGALYWFSSSSQDVQNGVRNRFVNELDLLKSIAST